MTIDFNPEIYPPIIYGSWRRACLHLLRWYVLHICPKWIRQP